MKRALALAMVFLLVPGLARAQGYSLGFRGGLTSTDLSFEDAEDDDFESATGIILGGFVQFPLGEMLGIQAGLNYTQKGAEARGSDAELELDYFEVPVLGVLSFSMSGPLGARLMAGPVVSFELSCDIGDENASVDCEETGIETESMDIGLHFGGGILYDIQSVAALFLDVGYNLGLRNIDASDGDGSAKNRALMVSVGVDFPMGG